MPPLQNTEIVVGQSYTTWYVIRFPNYFGDEFMGKHVIPALLRASNLFKTIRIDSAAPISPTGLLDADAANTLPFKVPPEFKSGRAKPWALVVQWHKSAETVQGTTEAGIDGVTKIIIGAVVILLGTLTFRSFTVGVAGGIAAGARRTIGNPGFVLAVVVIVALIFGARARG